VSLGVIHCLDLFFALAMPNPTREQIRANYPDAFVRAFYHAMIVMLLDCTDQKIEDPRFKAAHSTL
jgi:hypothetical protein